MPAQSLYSWNSRPFDSDTTAEWQELLTARGGASEAKLRAKWRDQLDPIEESDGSLLHSSRELILRKEVRQLKRVLADKVAEVDFFRGALQKVEARRQRIGSSGEKASTTKSGR